MTLPGSNGYVVDVVFASGIGAANPSVIMWGDPNQTGEVFGFVPTNDVRETGSFEQLVFTNLPAGDYVIEVFDAGNIDNVEDDDVDDQTGGAVCFDVSVST